MPTKPDSQIPREMVGTALCAFATLRDCVGTFFENRKGDLRDWFFGLLTLYRTSWVAQRSEGEDKLAQESLGRKRYKEVMLGLAKEYVGVNNELHKPDMVRMPTTGLIVHQSLEDNSLDLFSSPASSEFKAEAEFKEPVAIGYTIKK